VIADELEFPKVQLATLSDRAYVRRLALMATRFLVGLIAVALLLVR
jgi:hypothetical protein